MSTTTHGPTTGSPPMIGRCLSTSEWLAYVAGYQFGPLEPSKFTLHHTWKPTAAQWAGLRSMQGMQKTYRDKGWSAAPHIYVAPDGIWLFTPMKDIGVHAGTGNGSVRQGWYSIGIEMVGDYDHEKPSGIIWEQTKAVLGGLTRRLGLSFRDALAFHRDTSDKSCPGWAVTKDWVISEVTSWLAVHHPNSSSSAPYSADSPLLGTPKANVAQVLKVLRSQGKNGEYTENEIKTIFLPTYWKLAAETGLDPVLAIAQMILETDYLRSFWAARPQRNPAGIGVNGRKQKSKPANAAGWAYNTERLQWEMGVSFRDWQKESIPAHLGRLLAYALPAGQGTPPQRTLIDTSLSYRTLDADLRGSAPALRALGAAHNPVNVGVPKNRWRGWAVEGQDYGEKIAGIANRMVQS